MPRILMKFFFFPGMVSLSVGLLVAFFAALFIIPQWVAPIGWFMLIITGLVMLRMGYKFLRLIISEHNYKKLEGGLLLLPPLGITLRDSYKKKHPLWWIIQLGLNTTVIGSLVIGITGGGVYLVTGHRYIQDASACVQTPTPMPPVANDILNATIESVTASHQPIGWQQTTNGKITATFSLTKGFESNHALAINVTQPDKGTASWNYTPKLATQGATYQYSDWYQAPVATTLLVQYQENGVTQYQTIDTTIPATTGWRHYSITFTMPDLGGDTLSVVVVHGISSKGSLTIDDPVLHTQLVQFVRPIISFTFDDGWKTQTSNALPLLCRYKIPGTFYLVSGYLNYLDYVNPRDVNSLIKSGEEIASHTIHHADLTQISQDQLQQEVAGSQIQLQEEFGQKVVDFATPYGNYNDDAIQVIKQYYQSHRSTDDGYNSPDDFDPYNILCITFEKPMTVTQLEAKIDEAVKGNKWIVIAFHQIDVTPKSDWNITPQGFEEVLQYAKSKNAAEMTVNQALSELYRQI